jgi:glycogen operon protein
VLCNKLMVAEPWDIGPGGYQLGQFPVGWLEWNDKFRDTQRGFWLTRREPPGALAQRLAGSSESFSPERRGAHSSVNFVTAHDGFTLSDVVSFNERHNLANGEDNRDGHGHNLSNNFGAEGPTDNPVVNALRLQHKRALLAATVFSLGTPMLLAGDDIGHSQKGNNNAYCQDNASTWLNWPDADLALRGFVAKLLQARRQRRALQSRAWWQSAGLPGQVHATWSTAQNVPLSNQEWNDAGNGVLALHLSVAASPTCSEGSAEHANCLLLINAGAHAVAFKLPVGPWFRHIATDCGSTADTLLRAEETLPAGCLWLASTHTLFT